MQVLPGVQTLPLGERVSLIEALAPLAAESFAAPSSSRGSVSADPSAAALPSLYNALLVSLNGDELRLQTAGELVELTQALAAAWQARKAAPGGAASAKRVGARGRRLVRLMFATNNANFQILLSALACVLLPPPAFQPPAADSCARPCRRALTRCACRRCPGT